jgi:hypothetical protein
VAGAVAGHFGRRLHSLLRGRRPLCRLVFSGFGGRRIRKEIRWLCLTIRVSQRRTCVSVVLRRRWPGVAALGIRQSPGMDIEIVRSVSAPAEALQSLRSAKRGVIRVTSPDTEAHLVCRFTEEWALLDFWVTHKGPVLCPWFTNRSLGPSEFRLFGGCPGCDNEMESDTASAFSREEACSVLEDYIRGGSLPSHVRTPQTSTIQLSFSTIRDGGAPEQDQNAIDWRPYETLRRDR